MKLEHQVTHDALERDAQRLKKAHDALQARARELERKAQDAARAAAGLNRSIGAALARLR